MKINRPNSRFQLTDEGKTKLKQFNDWAVLARNIDEEINNFIWEHTEGQGSLLNTLITLHITSKEYGDGVIISDDYNNVDYVYDQLTNYIGYDEDFIIIFFKSLVKYKLTTPFKFS